MVFKHICFIPIVFAYIRSRYTIPRGTGRWGRGGGRTRWTSDKKRNNLRSFASPRNFPHHLTAGIIAFNTALLM
jgi:hypothetical protein